MKCIISTIAFFIALAFSATAAPIDNGATSVQGRELPASVNGQIVPAFIVDKDEENDAVDHPDYIYTQGHGN
ncbi:unnamed protein product [Tilletia controversa]|uniref:Uncharacterized protein n=2 Tax=Tilletia TaxID=13289 RepID=A0A8T8TRH1_9BASI|nr:hypothetical protein CF336_g274 [Tilletia laevis]KAE8265538.1 hypothetical protein A4X03_0g193 [Tilletia caries]CAD6895895.1 unnamed protein product [Tilletia controversa]KAE8206816.1 hypothetical protein CF335_g1597 [Tilletia laevis]CAD6901876.1 unnamed protein product [Tilletia controversa]